MNKYEVLNEYFGYRSFRPGQEALIDAVLARRDVLGVMPTGAGKSLCYQVPALAQDGITLVISPLISLMRDQVMALVQTGAPAAYLNSSLSAAQFQEALRRMAQGRYKLVYVAPERLALPQFQELCSRLPIRFVAVDEAHCISQWGQDFRPDYLRIPEFLDALPERPVVGAYTATATALVKSDIESSLRLRDPLTLTTGFDRPNLYFAVEQPKNKNDALLKVLRGQTGRSGIVYCATRKKVEAVCEMLQEHGYAAGMYHAGLSAEKRSRNQEDFLYDRITVMVATNAFGMGIDKSNVSFVIHYNLPKSVEAYYQEAGRAGRDGSAAQCVLLYGTKDVTTQRFLIENGEPNPNLSPAQQAEAREQDYVRLAQMKAYAVDGGCLRNYLLRYFGEHPAQPCGNCSNCLSDFEEINITADAQQILACILSSGQRFGAALIAKILHGDEDARIRSYGLHRLATYGTLCRLPLTEIRRRIRTLLDQGFLIESDDYHVLTLEESAWEIQQGERVVLMRVERRKEAKKSERRKTPAEAADPVLFERLRQVRMELAKQEGCAAFIICSDATLRDMCDKRPRTMSELLEVSGVGQVKARRYGQAFLNALQNYMENSTEP